MGLFYSVKHAILYYTSNVAYNFCNCSGYDEDEWKLLLNESDAVAPLLQKVHATPVEAVFLYAESCDESNHTYNSGSPAAIIISS